EGEQECDEHDRAIAVHQRNEVRVGFETRGVAQQPDDGGSDQDVDAALEHAVDDVRFHAGHHGGRGGEHQEVQRPGQPVDEIAHGDAPCQHRIAECIYKVGYHQQIRNAPAAG